MGHSRTFLGALIKLRKRHLWEWDTLATTQQQVWNLAREETARKSSVSSDNKLAVADLKSRLAARLIKIMIRQREDREQMKARHKQEEASLRQVFESSQANSN